MRKLFSEILKDVTDAPEVEDKVMVLQTNNSLMLRQLLAAALDPQSSSMSKYHLTVKIWKKTATHQTHCT